MTNAAIAAAMMSPMVTVDSEEDEEGDEWLAMAAAQGFHGSKKRSKEKSRAKGKKKGK